MHPVAAEAISVLEQAGVDLAPGLSDLEFTAVQQRYGFQFAPDHRALLAAAVPTGDLWPNWHQGDAHLHRMLDWPIEGFVWDALHQDPPFWPASWGARPADAAEVERIVRRELAAWPRLVPIYGHRYTPAAPAPPKSPVFSVYQTDVIYYGPDLVGYLRNEFGVGAAARKDWSFEVTVPFWSRFVESANSADSI